MYKTMDKYLTDRRIQRWTPDKEARLIGLYEQNRLLWDSRHPDYHNKDKREGAMSAIAQALQDEFDVLDVKNKIKWLRDYFVKELKRELGLTVKRTSHQRPSCQGYVSRWEHFHKWAFLRSICSADLCSPSTTNAPDSQMQNDSADVRPPIPNGEGRSAEMPASTQDFSSNDSRPQTPSVPPKNNAACNPVPVTMPVCEPCAPSRSSTTSTPAALVMGTRRSESHVPTPTSDKEHEDAVPAFRVPSADEKRGHDLPASDVETGPRNEPGFATIGDVSVDLFSLHVMWQLREMNQYQRDLAILRIRQQLFDAQYAVQPSVAVVGAAQSTAVVDVGTSHHTESQPASTAHNSRTACALRLPSPIRTASVEIRGTKQTGPGARPASA